MVEEYEEFVKCTRINCLFNTHCTMQCTHDMHETSPSGECKFYVIRNKENK